MGSSMTRPIRSFAQLLAPVLALLALAWSGPALAEVRIHFHSFNGSVLFGRYPHTFVVLEGTLDATGEPVNENYGFSAKRANTAVLSGPVEHVMLYETQNNIRNTNRHFSLTLSDEQYREVVALVRSWQNAPGRFYDLKTRNCIHFVGEIGRLVGLRVEYPDDMLRRPRKWLNHIERLNPGLGVD